MEHFNYLKNLILELENDFDTFYNKESKRGQAGVRIRKAMQDLKTRAQEIRLEVQDIKNKDKEAATSPKKKKK